MNGVQDKNRFRHRGLFAKYVFSLVGLVVFVLAVNGAFEVWISYDQTKTSLVHAMSEKADATAHRVGQSIADLERQISWVTRASVVTVEQRRADYTELLNQVPAVNQIFQLDGAGREQLRLSRHSVSVGSGADFSRDLRFTQTVSKGVTYAPAFFRDQLPFMSIAVAHSGRDAGASVAEVDLRFLSEYVDDAQIGKTGTAYIVDSHGLLLASSDKNTPLGKNLSALPQIAALLKPGAEARTSGTSAQGQPVLTASSPVQKLGWFVLFEQPTSQALAPIHDLLIRIALLVALGLAVAALTGGLRGTSALVGLVMLPLAVPLLIFGAGSTDGGVGAVKLLAAVSLLLLAGAPFVAGAAMRAGMD